MATQDVAGTITPLGEVTEFLIEADNPGGQINPFGSVVAVADFNVSAPDLSGTITPTGEMTTVTDQSCFPVTYACTTEPVTDYDCVGACESPTLVEPPSVELSGVIIPVGQLAEECPESMTCCLLCGDVTPEGTVDGDIACIYEWTAADVTSPALDHPIWAKLAGSGNTGWGAMYGLPGDGALSVRVGPLADASGDDSIAAGAASIASNEDAAAFGSEAQATGLYSLAVGHGSLASAEHAIAVGPTSQAIGDHDAAFGYGALASGTGGTVAVAYQAQATGLHGISMGYQSNNDSESAIAIGYQALVDACLFATAIGCQVIVQNTLNPSDPTLGYGSVAIGAAAEIQASAKAIAIGEAASIAEGGDFSSLVGSVGQIDGTLSSGLGSGLSILSDRGVMVGADGTIGTGCNNSIAIGYSAEVRIGSPGGMAIGYDSVCDQDYGIALGYLANTNADNQAMIGSNDATAFVKEVRFNGGGAASPQRAPNFVFGNAALATGATDGFPYLPSCAGTPSGAPTSYASGAAIPCIVDTTAGKVWFYYGAAWHFTTLT